MAHNDNYLKDIGEIRSMMERSSRFISLSGLSGVFAGIFALLGAAVAYYFLGTDYFFRHFDDWSFSSSLNYDEVFRFLFINASIVLLLSLSAGIFFTTRKAKKQGHKIWDKTARKLLISISIPLVAGGVFCLALLYHGIAGLVAPATLVFYGLALLNGSKYTLDDIKYLGICEITLGLISAFFIGYGLLFWAVGFGVLHIIYGTTMYFKYEVKYNAATEN